MKTSFFGLGLSIILSFSVAHSVAYAETLYTSLQETIVRDQPVVTGSQILIKLPAGSMIETIKQVGGFTEVSYIADGKVKTGYIANAQLNPETPEGSGPEILGTAPNAAAEVGPPALPIPPPILNSGASKLDRIKVSTADLTAFAKSGQLVERKPKGRSTK